MDEAMLERLHDRDQELVGKFKKDAAAAIQLIQQLHDSTSSGNPAVNPAMSERGELSV